MDRRAFAVYAGILASFGTVLGAGCGTETVPPVAGSRITPQPGAGPGSRESLRGGPAVPAVGFADRAGMPPAARRSKTAVVPVVALAGEGDASSGGEADAPPPTASSDPSETQLKFAAGRAKQKLSDSLPAPVLTINTQAESEFRFATRGPGPESASPPACTIRVPAVNIPVPADNNASTDNKASDNDLQTNALRRPDLSSVVVPKSEVPPQDASQPNPPNGEASDRDPSATLDITPIAIDPANPVDSVPLRTQLPWAENAPHSPEMIAVAGQRVRLGFQLAGQGALYLARAEFIAALKLIAQTNDVRHGTRWYSKAVAAGFLALKESTDFVSQNAGIEDADVAKIVAGHKTPILKHVDASEMTPIVAAQRYYTYAQEQFSAAAAQEMTGSMALYGLGKVTIAVMGNKSPQPEYTGQARALYQAALMAEPNNYLAANELGVLLAEVGQPQPARELLIRSICLSPQPATWQNLAAVHSQLGERKLAETAQEQAIAMRRSGRGVGGPAVQWVDPATFVRMTPSTDNLPPAAVPAKAESEPAQITADSAKAPENVVKKGAADWLPWNLRR